jgi:hypothetical protein
LRCPTVALVLLAALLGSEPAAADERRAYSVVPHSGLFWEIEPTHDGGLLVTITDGDLGSDEPHAVLHVDRRWRLRHVAGQRPESEGNNRFSGDGGPATQARLTAAGLAALPDGGFLIADSVNCRVHRVGARGILNTVAGRTACSPSLVNCYQPTPCPPSRPSGDGGPAVAASLLGPSGIAETPDGGFLVAETFGHRIRRVAPDGTISTVAGTGEVPNLSLPLPPYTGRATEVVLKAPSHVEATADGGFLFSDLEGLHKVSADGLIQTLIPPRPTGSIYPIADGGIVYDTSRGLSEFRSGSFVPVIHCIDTYIDTHFFPAWGDRLPRLETRECGFGDAQPIEGGALVATSSTGLILVAPPRTTRLGAAIARESLPALQHRRLVVRSTRTARLTVTLARRANVAATVRAPGRPGLNSIRLPSRLPPGLYRATLEAESANGSRVVESRRLLVGRFLPTRVARSMVIEVIPEFFAEGASPYLRGCKRFGQRRVDCVVGIHADDSYDARSCRFGLAVVLRRTGYVMQRRYHCGSTEHEYFSGRPVWIGAAVQAPDLVSVH